MKFFVYKASGRYSEGYEIEIESLQDLAAFDKKTGNHSLIIDFELWGKNKLPTITIYDDHIE